MTRADAADVAAVLARLTGAPLLAGLADDLDAALDEHPAGCGACDPERPCAGCAAAHGEDEGEREAWPMGVEVTL